MPQEETRQARKELNQRVYILRCDSKTPSLSLRKEAIFLYENGPFSTIAFQEDFYKTENHFEIKSTRKDNRKLNVVRTQLEILITDLADKNQLVDIYGNKIDSSSVGNVVYVGRESQDVVEELIKRNADFADKRLLLFTLTCH